jgi:hypothetical protein
VNAHARNRSWLAIAALVAAPLAHAMATPLPPQQTTDRLTYLNGGVGKDDAAMFKRIAPGYPLRVVMAERNGWYSVADRFTVLHDGQPMGTIDDAGPWLLIKVPPGHYTLVARFGGVTERRSVDVGAAGTTLQWQAPDGL